MTILSLSALFCSPIRALQSLILLQSSSATKTPTHSLPLTSQRERVCDLRVTEIQRNKEQSQTQVRLPFAASNKCPNFFYTALLHMKSSQLRINACFFVLFCIVLYCLNWIDTDMLCLFFELRNSMLLCIVIVFVQLVVWFC